MGFKLGGGSISGSLRYEGTSQWKWVLTEGWCKLSCNWLTGKLAVCDVHRVTLFVHWSFRFFFLANAVSKRFISKWQKVKFFVLRIAQASKRKQLVRLWGRSRRVKVMRYFFGIAPHNTQYLNREPIRIRLVLHTSTWYFFTSQYHERDIRVELMLVEGGLQFVLF